MTRPQQHLTFVVLTGISVMIWWRPLIATFALALRNDEYTHILLILPISAALVILQRRSLSPAARPSFGAGGCVLGLAALVAAWSKWEFTALPPDMTLSLCMLALVMWWVGTFILCFGIRAFRSLLFPLLFLFWLVPLPAFLVNKIVSVLQQDSVSITHFFFVAAGVPVSRDGVLLSIPGLTIEVAKECSSIRSSLMLVVTSMVLAHLFLRSPWRKAAIVMAAVPLSVIKNAVRIFTLSLLGTNVDPEFLTGRLHQEGGIIFFAISLAAVCLLIWALQKTEVKISPEQTRPRATESPAIQQ